MRTTRSGSTALIDMSIASPPKVASRMAHLPFRRQLQLPPAVACPVPLDAAAEDDVEIGEPGPLLGDHRVLSRLPQSKPRSDVRQRAGGKGWEERYSASSFASDGMPRSSQRRGGDDTKSPAVAAISCAPTKQRTGSG